MIKQIDMMRVIQEHRGDAVVIPVFRATPRWREVSSHPELDPAGLLTSPFDQSIL